MSDATAALVIQDVQSVLQSIADLQGKTVFVYDDEDLSDKLKMVKMPAAGIIYEGMRSVGDSGDPRMSLKLGVSAEMVFTIIVVMQPEVMFKADAKTPVIDLLDSVRASLLHRRSPTGHYYRFLVEAPAYKKNGLAFWVQRWQVPLQNKPVNQ